MVSLVPANTAVAEPDPATASRMPPSIGTVASRALYRSWFCATTGRASERAATAITNTATHLEFIIHLRPAAF
jgi:hypothetical protein